MPGTFLLLSAFVFDFSKWTLQIYPFFWYLTIFFAEYVRNHSKIIVIVKCHAFGSFIPSAWHFHLGCKKIEQN